MNVLLVVTAGVLCACGTYLLLGRQLSRIIIGIGLLGHGINILLVLSGGDGGAPAFVGGDIDRFADPLPQALVLTAIVITFGVIAFLLALAVGTALVPLALGDGALNQDAYELQVQLLGKVKATTATAFDAGVYLIVIGLVLMIFEGLGDEFTGPAGCTEPAPDEEGPR